MSSSLNFFSKGFKVMLPITTGVIPFGVVMGTIASHANLSLFQSTSMNVFVFAGAAQLAALDLMLKNTSSVVVIATGLIINLRFLLYSAALVPVVQGSNLFTKLLSAYWLTDQSYAVMSAHNKKLTTNTNALRFYLGAGLCMALVWHASVLSGFFFGNFAPSSWALDYAVPLSFVVLVIPTLKDKNHVAVAVFSSCVSIFLTPMPFKVGLIITALSGVALGVLLSSRKKVK